MLEERGAEAIEAPTIRIAPPEDYGAARRGGAPSAAIVRLDHLHERERRRSASCSGCSATGDVRELKGVSCAPSGRRPRRGCARYGLRVDLMPAEYRAEAVIDALRGAGAAQGQARPAAARRHRARGAADELRKAGAEVTEVVAYRTTLAAGRARRRPRHLPDAARPADRRRDVHERVGGPQLRRRSSARSRRPTCCAAPSSRRSGR